MITWREELPPKNEFYSKFTDKILVILIMNMPGL